MAIHTLLTALLLAQLFFTPASCGAAPTSPTLGGGDGQAVAQETAATTITGRVVGIADGDTITVLDQENRQHRVRLKGIDAPESGQAYGQDSKQHLSSMLFKKEGAKTVPQTVTVTYSKLDRYGRALGIVRVGKLEVNLAQVAAGFAWFYREYQDELTPAERAAYAAAEERARREPRGLWKQRNPVKPSEYRRGGN